MKLYSPDTETAGTGTADEAASAVEPGDFASEVLGRMGLKPDGGALPPQPETKVETIPPPEPKPEPVTKKEVIPDKLFEKKEEPAKETKSEIDGIEEPQFRSDKSKADWGKLKSYAKQQEEAAKSLDLKIKELTAQVDAAKDGSKREAELQSKLEAAQKTMDEYKGIVQKVNMDADPDFRRTYVDGKADLVKEGKTIAGESDVDVNAVEAALLLPEGRARTKALETAMEGMSMFQQGRLGEIVTKISRLDREAEAKRGNPQEYFKQQEQAFKERQESEQKKYVEATTKAFRNAEAQLSDKLIVLRRLDGEEHKEWNEGGDKIRTQSREFWETNSDPQRAAEMIIKGFAAERYESAYVDIRKDRDGWKEKAEKFEKELEGLYSTGPKLGAQSTATKDGKPKDWADMVEDKMMGRT